MIQVKYTNERTNERYVAGPIASFILKLMRKNGQKLDGWCEVGSRWPHKLEWSDKVLRWQLIDFIEEEEEYED